MNYKNKLNQIRVVLGLQIKLASEKLVDGTKVEAEEFAPGMDLMVVAEDGSKSPAPAGEHVTESGLKVKVDDAGKIVSVEKEESESEGPKVEIEVEKAAEPVKMAEEDKGPIDGSQPEAPKKEDAVEEKIAEVMKKVMAAMEPMLQEMADMKAKIAKMEEQYSKFAKAPAASKISTYNPQTEKAESVDIVERFKELKKTL